MIEKLHTNSAPQPVGPYSQAIRTGSLVFVAGQLGIDPEAGKLVEGGTAAQARQVLKNLAAIAASAGGSLDDAVKTTVFLKDFNDFSVVNAIYAEFFGTSSPARSTVEVSRLPLDGLIEIDAVLSLPARSE